MLKALSLLLGCGVAASIVWSAFGDSYVSAIAAVLLFVAIAPFVFDRMQPSRPPVRRVRRLH